MHSEKVKRLKRYLFYISVFFTITIGGHFVYLFLHVDAIETPEKWGILSEAMIASQPTLNPLLLESEANEKIVSLLYRSLMRYDLEASAFVPDIADCNTQRLNMIRCSINENQLWSDGTPITNQDVLKTFESIVLYRTNPNLLPILNLVRIFEQDGQIIITSAKNDINILQLLLQPIASTTAIANQDNFTAAFKTLDARYSGKYMLESISSDSETDIDRIILTQNPYFETENFIERREFLFFKDLPHLMRHRDEIKAFYDRENVLGRSIPRLETYPYYLNQFVGVFLNSATLKNTELRARILDSLNRDEIVSTLGENYKTVQNPYGTRKSIDRKAEGFNLIEAIEQMGYFPKGIVAEKLIEQQEEDLLDEKLEEYNSDLEYIVSPITRKYTFVQEDNILIQGNLNGESPDAIWFNDYRLNGYSKGNSSYFIRLRQSFWNMSEGRNEYNIYFETNGERELKETFTIFLYSNATDFENRRKEWEGETKQEIRERTNFNTTIDPELQAQIDALDEKQYYNADLEPLMIRIFYIDTLRGGREIAEYIRGQIGPIGLDGELVEITIDTLPELLEEKPYDIFVAGINGNYLDFDLYSYFHSSQARSGYNLSQAKNPDLDILLEELKSNNLNFNKRDELKSRILDILEEQQVIKTIYNPPMYYLLDKNIKNFDYNPDLPSMTLRENGLDEAYIRSERIVQTENKNLATFLQFLRRIINE